MPINIEVRKGNLEPVEDKALLAEYKLAGVCLACGKNQRHAYLHGLLATRFCLPCIDKSRSPPGGL